jgi:uncharacterized damage-inducible protein DinB
MLTHLARLVEHLAWADAEVLAALRSAPGAPASAREIYAHVLGAEHVWLARLRERPPKAAVWPSASLAECAELAAHNARELRDFVAGLGPGDLDRTVHYVNSAGRAFDSTIADILLHVMLHGSYHRGQVALLIRSQGAAPAPTDYIGFVRGVPAARRLPL